MMIVSAAGFRIPESIKPFFLYVATFVLACVPLALLWKASRRSGDGGQEQGRRIDHDERQGEHNDK